MATADGLIDKGTRCPAPIVMQWAACSITKFKGRSSKEQLDRLWIKLDVPSSSLSHQHIHMGCAGQTDILLVGCSL